MPNNTHACVCILKVWVVKILEMDILAFEVVVVLIPMLYRIPFKINSSVMNLLRSVT